MFGSQSGQKDKKVVLQTSKNPSLPIYTDFPYFYESRAKPPFITLLTLPDSPRPGCASASPAWAGSPPSTEPPQSPLGWPPTPTGPASGSAPPAPEVRAPTSGHPTPMRSRRARDRPVCTLRPQVAQRRSDTRSRSNSARTASRRNNTILPAAEVVSIFSVRLTKSTPALSRWRQAGSNR